VKKKEKSKKETAERSERERYPTRKASVGETVGREMERYCRAREAEERVERKKRCLQT